MQWAERGGGVRPGFALPSYSGRRNNLSNQAVESWSRLGGSDMGSMSFLLPEELPAGVEELLPLACLASGYDQTLVPTTVRVESGRLQVSRRVSESSFLVVPWPVNSGAIVCMTS